MRKRQASSLNERGLRSRTRLGRGSKVVGFLFGLPFFLMGGFFCWIGGLQPLFKAVGSGNWPAVPCVITQSEVESHSDSDGTTYSVDIQFRYTVADREYNGGRYDFSTGSSSGRNGKARVVRDHPVGQQTVCFVNPVDPAEAVLSRNIPGIVYFVIPFSSIFILIGLGIMLASLGILPEKWRAKVRSRHKPVSQTDEGEKQLKPKATSLGKLAGSIIFACMWNGIVGVFVWQVVESFSKGRPQWFLVLFLIPFVAAGLFMIFLVFYYLLALSNPRFTVSLNRGAPRLGDTVDLNWRVTGAVSRLTTVVFTLEGVESATYRRGTNSVTDRSTFCREILHEERNFTSLASGTFSLTLPVASMHTFNGGNNRIEWQIRVSGSIHRWPDVDDTFPLTVRPIKLR